jgi:hypothetical protein
MVSPVVSIYTFLFTGFEIPGSCAERLYVSAVDVKFRSAQLPVSCGSEKENVYIGTYGNGYESKFSSVTSV